MVVAGVGVGVLFVEQLSELLQLVGGQVLQDAQRYLLLHLGVLVLYGQHIRTYLLYQTVGRMFEFRQQQRGLLHWLSILSVHYFGLSLQGQGGRLDRVLLLHLESGT